MSQGDNDQQDKDQGEEEMKEIKPADILEEMNKLRKSWEIEDHWILRRDFMILHHSKFNHDRLLCLAQIFVNIETLGTSYDINLMDKIKDLTYDIPSLDNFRKRKAELEAGARFKAPPKKKFRQDGNNWHSNNRGAYGQGGYNQNRGHGYGQGGGGGGGYNNRGWHSGGGGQGRR